MYLARIEAYDQQGPAVNAMITINPQVLATAQALDAERLLTGPRSPLHGIPVVLKDNFDTADLPTTAASVSLQGSIPPDDAFLTERFREAGALILGKTNLHEFAAGYATVSSLGGQTLNPYDTTRIPGGSSGGTGAAIAANFAAIGMGTDTVGSIRIPASFNNLVGLKPTLGLTSRDGIIPLTLTRDVAGPMTRSVEDAAIVLDVIAGFDPADPVTAASAGQIPASYTDFLDADGLNGARIGVLRSRVGTHPDVGALTNAAIADMTAAGAQMVDPITVPWLGFCATYYHSFEYDMNNYLESLGAGAPFSSLQALIASGQYMSSMNVFPFGSCGGLRGDIPPDQDPLYFSRAQTQASVQVEVMGVMNGQNLDAILYPSLMAPPPVVGDPLVGITSDVGSNANLAAFIGYPAISVPAGFTSGGLPVGVELLGKPFDEPTLIRLAYAYEQATKHRQPPAATPPLPGETPEIDIRP
jgi:Asp-tRNA(Asn)/Glu-tRNA(Gln) amidotransferase A subunit family amidase